MKFLPLILAFAAITTAQLNTTQSYKLKTKVKGRPPGKDAFNNLYLQSYHTGAGISDVSLTTNATAGIKGFLKITNITTPDSYDGHVYNQVFDLGNEFPWGLVMVPYDTFYTQWQPVEINAGAVGSGYTVSGFFINETGLQWTSSPGAIGSASDSFGGWFVCDWWHGTLQLFFRLYPSRRGVTPCSCADVYLVPEYI
ncbi:hypothetical protein M409DRAFT_24812 [Zasmidium cellare ATCC 36951]|uniref:DUF7907 domain-containing protein n=1 Tax=Zasmidium cellare ATCC 36951 TaxID=1080233 RepID=A0A6A6CGV7_ZASCE|nr:uncharacterized protein M409DRAFT_24812 [Zasmidium cellare ATCC 36951]KAF2164909.1 hypothetical protein M409DRAFT_24812 [Zasmidium cellare ATCC 36951]